MVLRLIRTLPGDRLSCPRVATTRVPRVALGASTAAPGPYDFAVRRLTSRLRKKRLVKPRPSHPAPNVRDDREAPLLIRCGTRGNLLLICPTVQANSFFQKGWTGFCEACPSGKSAGLIERQSRRSYSRGRSMIKFGCPERSWSGLPLRTTCHTPIWRMTVSARAKFFCAAMSAEAATIRPCGRTDRICPPFEATL